MSLNLKQGRCFTLNNRRELFYTYAISLVLFLYAASTTQQTSFLFYILFYVLSGIFVLLTDHVDQKLSIAKGGDQEALLKGIHLPVKGWSVSVLIAVLGIFIYFIVPKPPPAGIEAFPVEGSWYGQNGDWEDESEHEGVGGNDGVSKGEELGGS